MNYIAFYTLKKREKLKRVSMTFTTEGKSYSSNEL